MINMVDRDEHKGPGPKYGSRENATPAQLARRAGLVYVHDRSPGIRRRRSRKNGFTYVIGRTGRPISEKNLIRIRALAVPPAYRDVWICSNPRGHLQASGRDARGRKQYRYHPLWREARDREKFARVVEFASALPRLRRRVTRDLARDGLPRERVLAAIVRLLDTTRARVGNAEYARANRTYGLSTLRDRHVRGAPGHRTVLDFPGKGGARHTVTVTDARLARIVRACRRMEGSHLFQFEDDTGRNRPVTSGDVNAYLREHMGGKFTAKDFRTWSATLRAIQILARTPVPKPPVERPIRLAIKGVVNQVAEELRNTPAVCRRSYICPIVFDAWRRGALEAVTKQFSAGAETRRHPRSRKRRRPSA